jgi:hypothetical protein
VGYTQGLKLFLKLDGVPSNLSNLAASFDSREVRTRPFGMPRTLLSIELVATRCRFRLPHAAS